MAFKPQLVVSNPAPFSEPKWISAPDDSAALLVRSVHFPAFRDQYTEQFRSKVAALRAGQTLQGTWAADLLQQMCAKHLLLGWRGLPVEYSPAAASERLASPEGLTFLGEILSAALRVVCSKAPDAICDSSCALGFQAALAEELQQLVRERRSRMFQG